MNGDRTPKISQFIGSILGQCVGDGAGFIVEGRTGETCEAYVKTHLEVKQIPDKRVSWLTYGQYTDDSQLARELMQSMVTHKNFDPEDYSIRIAKIFDEERIVGHGMATFSAAVNLINGIHWRESGTLAPYAGNGGAMRAGPIGLMFHNDFESLIKNARDQAYITHKDLRAQAGSIVIAASVAYALTHKKIDISKFIKFLSKSIKEISPVFSRDLLNLKKWLQSSYEVARTEISQSGEPDQFTDWDGISPYVIPSVLWSLYSFLKSPNDYWKIICTSIKVGGDVDTTAAMAGAISGAYLGENAIPEKFVSKINDKGEWKADDLKGLATELFHIIHPN